MFDEVKQVGDKPARRLSGIAIRPLTGRRLIVSSSRPWRSKRRVGMFVIGLIILVAGLNITSTLILVVTERRFDIAILRTMGATTKSIMIVFISEGAVNRRPGNSDRRVFSARFACLAGNHYKTCASAGRTFTSIGSVPFNWHLRDVLLAAFIAFLLSLLATIYSGAGRHGALRPV